MNTQAQVKEAIARAGGVAAVAAHFGISPVSVYEWIKRGYAPADKCPEIEKFSNGASRCEALNAKVDWEYLRLNQSPGLVARPHGHAGRQPPSPTNILDTVPARSVVLPATPPSLEPKEKP
ncbi:YdaS family helix-turn-helix protein [Janthinobacterium sp. UMAB-56]|uniref:YdaS family helix-turn-helix protein n=1 Tax=Janthinobacterium sp. UMAB-56 TaxID=1365361 RepID=UPI001C59D230|nr:YdaS family helix-turn-helix protein [Janthinobacterium sp. UMAB-56]